MFAYPSNFKEMNMKDISFSKEINNFNAYRLLGNFMLLYWEKTYVLSFEMPPFVGSNYIRIKRPVKVLYMKWACSTVI